MMRKQDKAALGKLLTKDASVADIGINQTQFVLDGGALLASDGQKHVLACCRPLSAICNSKIWTKRCCSLGWLFSAQYQNHEHNRRLSKMAASVSNASDTFNYPNQQAFFANTENKARLIAYLISYFEVNGIICVRQAGSDADTLIVRVALDFAAAAQNVTVIADDTDVLVLLIYHWHPSMAHVYMKREPRGTLEGATISIPVIQQTIGANTVKRLPVVHVISGSDTTSAVYGHGKATAFKKLPVDSLGNFCDTVSTKTSTPDDVSHAGNKLLVALYGGIPGIDTLDKLRT